ncbi:MAG: hypothetical protein OXT09_24715 [Myxococcales bacterium]|nr:hypothetical protein [Myxococcales bacterium]
MCDETGLERPRFAALWRALGGDGGSCFDTLARAYGSGERHYHTDEHIRECLAWLDRVQHLAARPAELEAAIWFHDAVYDTASKDNEARSAGLWRDAATAAGIEPAVIERVAELIVGTAHTRQSATADARLLADIDLGILGAAPARYRRYEQAIRREYESVPEPAFRRGRAAVLAAFLERTAIYQTPYFYERLERQARENLAEAIGALTS